MQQRKKRIVTLGGGTGHFSVLKGLKKYPFDITAVVTMFDSGGSSGILRDEFGILPPGDVLRCLIALSEGEKGEIIREVFNYHFPAGSSLERHTFGNLLITMLMSTSGDDAVAIGKAGKLFDIKGQVLPVTLNKAHLCAELGNREIVEGEANIPKRVVESNSRIQRVFLKPDAYLYDGAEEAIEEADVIVMSPGDLYTSLIPTLLVEGMREALQESKAKKVYILNLMTRQGETDGFSASAFAHETLKYAGLQKFDCIIYHSQSLPEDVLARYKDEGKYPIEIDGELKGQATTLIPADVHDASVLRHDSDKIAAIIAEVSKTNAGSS